MKNYRKLKSILRITILFISLAFIGSTLADSISGISGKDYEGKNVAAFGYTSMGGEYRDAYGASTIVLVLMPDDGTYIDLDDEETIK